MAIEKHHIVDAIAYDPEQDRVILGLMSMGCWGKTGERLFDLLTKIKTYLAYALEGPLQEDYPELSDKTIVIRLYHNHGLGDEEMELVQALRSDYLKPAGIKWEQHSLPRHINLI